MDRGCIVAVGHAQEIFEDVRLDAAFGVRFERLKVGRHALCCGPPICESWGPLQLGFIDRLFALSGLNWHRRVGSYYYLGNALHRPGDRRRAHPS
jgi:hypothetical protein